MINIDFLKQSLSFLLFRDIHVNIEKETYAKYLCVYVKKSKSNLRFLVMSIF